MTKTITEILMGATSRGRIYSEKIAEDIETMSGRGMSHRDMAVIIGHTPKTLRKHYRLALDIGKAKANGAIGKSLYDKAVGNGSSSAACAMFWAKTQMGWKETSVTELTGADGGPVEIKRTADDISKSIESKLAKFAAGKSKK